MTLYQTVDIPFSEDDLANLALAYMESQVSGWSREPARYETWLFQAIARMASELAYMASQVPDAVYIALGQTVFGLELLTGAPAGAEVIVTINPGPAGAPGPALPIPAGTTISVDGSLFITAADETIPAGLTVSDPIPITALSIGTAGNDLIGQDVRMSDSISRVTSVELVGVTAGGEDAETAAQYRERFTKENRLRGKALVRADDCALAASQDPGVAAAAGVDGLIPGVGTSEQRACAVALRNELGQPVAQVVKDRVQAMLESRREPGFIFTIADPTDVQIAVTYSVATEPGSDRATVLAAVNGALAEYLNRATWGRTGTTDSEDAAGGWRNTPVVRHYELGQVINGVAGVDYIITLQFGPPGNLVELEDYTMPGDFPVAELGPIVATAT